MDFWPDAPMYGCHPGYVVDPEEYEVTPPWALTVVASNAEAERAVKLYFILTACLFSSMAFLCIQSKAG